jgi:hypothetical protein
MSFVDLALFMMNMVNKTMQTEVNNFIKNVKQKPMKYGKSAMSKARVKISPALFIDLNKGMLEDIYSDKEEIKLHHGFRIIGVDGSTVALPNMEILKDKKQSENIKEIYGKGSNQKGEYGATTRISIMYDLENKFVLDGIMSSIHSGERFMAVEHIDKLIELKKNVKEDYRDLLIYDRGYPSFGLIKYHYKRGLDFLIRVDGKSSFKEIQEFTRSKKVDKIIEIEVSKYTLSTLSKEKQHPNIKTLVQELKVGDKIKVRVIKVILPNGTVEVLLTSLLSEEEYPREIFKELYFKRWGVEIGFDVIKNIFNLENFTGLTQIAINQDFYAIILTNNLCSLILNDVMEEKVSRYNALKKRKYLYQINRSFAIGCMKNKLVLLLQKNVREEKIYKMIEDEIMGNLGNFSFSTSQINLTKNI